MTHPITVFLAVGQNSSWGENLNFEVQDKLELQKF
jgi:hypothetical protein